MNTKREIIYDVKEKRGTPKGNLEKLLGEWQKKLKMDDWVLDLKIVDFRREDDYRQSGDFISDCKNKTATVLLTWDPWRGDEEYTLVHEMIHILVSDLDKYSEGLILECHEPDGPRHEEYIGKIEDLVHHLTRVFLGRSDR